MTDDSSTSSGKFEQVVSRIRRYAIEAGIGLTLAAVVLWAITAAGGDVTFVYQGL
ncbi:MAG: hypothetical protein ACI83Y_001977 [Candidatus Azotimanducaceae bacterium]|jgi:hypothetical protein